MYDLLRKREKGGRTTDSRVVGGGGEGVVLRCRLRLRQLYLCLCLYLCRLFQRVADQHTPITTADAYATPHSPGVTLNTAADPVVVKEEATTVLYYRDK